MAIRILAIYGFVIGVIQYSPISDWMVRPLVVRADPGVTDAIVLMSAWASPDGTLNESGVWRTLEAARLLQERLAPTIMVSGRTLDPTSGDPAESMANMLVRIGVPRASIEVEADSTNTHESAVYVSQRLKSRHISRILLVTDAKHMRRARAAFERQGVTVRPAPTMEWEVWWGQPYDRQRKFFGAIHEYLGILYYWWHGWI